MANDPNKDEMMNKEVKTEGASGENGGEPKKKKITAVFRTQNSRQNRVHPEVQTFAAASSG